MTLSDRLNTLRRQGGASPALPVDDETLRQRLQRLQNTRDRHVAATAPVRRDDAALAAEWGGRILAPGLVLIERRIGLNTSHGRQGLGQLLKPIRMLHEAKGHIAERLCFFDTETSGLSGGSGTVVFLLGMGRIEGDALVVRQYQLTAFAGERAMFEHAAAWLGEEGILVSYNGKSFDAPLLATRCRLAGIGSPWCEREHIDLLHPTRRAFARQWDDCRLASVERHLLGFRRTDDLPGAEVPLVWQGFLHQGQSGRMRKVIEHNFWDILSLAALLPALDDVYHDPRHHQADTATIARHMLKHNEASRAESLLISAWDRLEDEGKLLLADIYRRQQRWRMAEPILRQLAETGSNEAVERLAKYHEHQRHDYRTALRYARSLPKEQQHTQRCERLCAKLSQESRVASLPGLFD